MRELTDSEMNRLRNELLVQYLFEVMGVKTASAQAEFMRRAKVRVQQTIEDFSAPQLAQILFQVDKYD